MDKITKCCLVTGPYDLCDQIVSHQKLRPVVLYVYLIRPVVISDEPFGGGCAPQSRNQVPFPYPRVSLADENIMNLDFPIYFSQSVNVVVRSSQQDTRVPHFFTIVTL